MRQDEKDNLINKFLACDLSETERLAFEDLIRLDKSFAKEVAMRMAESDAFHRARVYEKAQIRQRYLQRRWLRWVFWMTTGTLGVIMVTIGCPKIFMEFRSDGSINVNEQDKKRDASDEGKEGTQDSIRTILDSINDTETEIATHIPIQSPTTSRQIQRSKLFYVQIAKSFYRPLKRIQTASQDTSGNQIGNEHELAFNGYLNKDSSIVHAYYLRYPNDRRAIEWRARFLFEHGYYEEAAIVFSKLKSIEKYEDIGVWNELLCYVALYKTNKSDLERLKSDVRSTIYAEQLDKLLQQIQ